ncbi:MAG: NADH-quinone oxidoreductase subunit A, partial [Pirellulaceae bacterium]
ANLVIGRFVRPANPHPEKLEIYECGEPTIGSSFVQFDLRFYVVALLFIIFDVEVAFFFPWATVFGKSTHLMREDMVVTQTVDGKQQLTPDARALYQELGVRQPVVTDTVPVTMRETIGSGTSSTARTEKIAHRGGQELAWVTLVDILAFFGVLMIGFLYVWRRGDLDWVRALARERSAQVESGDGTSRGSPQEAEPALSA